MRASWTIVILLTLVVVSGCARKQIKKIEERISTMDVSEGLNAESVLKGIEASGYVDAPPAEVFAFCARTVNLRKFFPGNGGGDFADDPEVLSRPGDNFVFIYGDIPLFPSIHGRMVVTRIEKDRMLELFFVGPIWSRIKLYLEPEGEGTRITFRNMYQLTDFMESNASENFMKFIATLARRGIVRLSSKMGAEISETKPESKVFSVLCNTHRVKTIVGLPPDAVWERAVRTEFISEVLGSSARLISGDEVISERGQGFKLRAPAHDPVMDVSAVTVNAIPDHRLHLTLFLDEINGGAIAILHPDQKEGSTRIEIMFYYEIPSDRSIPPELFMVFATAEQDLESFVDNLSSSLAK